MTYQTSAYSGYLSLPILPLSSLQTQTFPLSAWTNTTFTSTGWSLPKLIWVEIFLKQVCKNSDAYNCALKNSYNIHKVNVVNKI
jgi:hypothetical protein